jgi:hypothetical protein
MKMVLFLLTILTMSIYAKDIALAKNITGKVYSQKANRSIEIKETQWLDEKSVISTKDNSSVTLIFKDTSTLVLGENSILALEKFIFKPKKEKYRFELKLKKGKASFESGKIGKLSPEDFIFKTPESTIAIRGTKFIVFVQ